MVKENFIFKKQLNKKNPTMKTAILTIFTVILGIKLRNLKKSIFFESKLMILI